MTRPEPTLSETNRKLGHVADRLCAEFSEFDRATARVEVASASQALIGRARFLDFVPLLTYCYAKERLQGGARVLRSAA